MDWLHTLLGWWASFSNLLYSWKVNSYGWMWPLNIIAPFFQALSSIADGLFSGFFDFVYWADRINRDIQEKAGQSWVYDLLWAFLSPINTTLSWLTNRLDNIGSTITNWWSGVSTTVLGWVEAAKGYALGLVNNLQGLVNSLQSWWNNFTATVLPSLASRFDVDQMIKSTFAPWADLFNFWGQVGSEIKAFFADPLQWVYNKLDDFFERFW